MTPSTATPVATIDKEDPRRDVVKRALSAELGHRTGRTAIARIATRVLDALNAYYLEQAIESLGDDEDEGWVQLPSVDELARRYALLHDRTMVTNADYAAATEALGLVQRAPQPTPRQRASEAITTETPLSPDYATAVIKAIETAGLRIVDAEGGEPS